MQPYWKRDMNAKRHQEFSHQSSMKQRSYVGSVHVIIGKWFIIFYIIGLAKLVAGSAGVAKWVLQVATSGKQSSGQYSSSSKDI